MMTRPSVCVCLVSLVLWTGANSVFAQAPAAPVLAPPDGGNGIPVGEFVYPQPIATEEVVPSDNRSGFIGGAGLYLLQPYFEDNLAYVLQSTSGQTAANPGSRTDTRVNISHQMEVAPLVWLGYLTKDGWGGRGRWWYFREGTSQSDFGTNAGLLAFSASPLGLALINGQGIGVTSKLQLQVADLEALDAVHAGRWNLLFSGGLRLTRIDQSYNAYIPQSNLNTLLSSHNFQGVGPTVSVEARRPLWQTGLALYGSARGSVVFGSAEQSATVPGLNEVATDHRNRGLPIGEVEFGLEYARAVRCSQVFGQVAFVGQEWFGAGNASRSTVNGVPGGALTGAGYVGDSDIAFLGLSVRMGLNY